MMQIKELNKDLIRIANNNSFGGKRGDIEEHEYKTYCERAISWGLSEQKTQKIINKIYDYFSNAIRLDSQHVSVAVAGSSNYNSKRLDKSDKILENVSNFVDWFNELEEEATAKPYSRIEWLVKKIIWGYGGDFTTNNEWKELAGRSKNDFDILYDELENKGLIKKNSIPYMIHKGLLEIEPIFQKPIYATDDFCVYTEQGNICIEFRMKPQRQLIVALKSRKFYYVHQHTTWKAKVNDDLIEWAKTIDKKYEQYI